MKQHGARWLLIGLVGTVGSIVLVAMIDRPATAEVPEVKAEVEGDIDMGEVRKHLDVLTGYETRLTGSVGEQGSREYIVRQLRLLGAVEITQQEFTVAVPVRRRGEVVGVIGGREVRVPVYPLWPNLARTCQTPPGGLRGRLVYGGKGSDAELRGLRLEGSLVVLDWDSDLGWLNVPEFGGQGVIFRGERAATRTLAQRKFLTVPADIPRYYVGQEDVGMLDALVASGAEVRVECEVAWERVSAMNIIGKISEGEMGRGGRVIDRTPVFFSAYYDSISVVPDRAPGAEQACSAAILLELARQLRKVRGPRPVYVLFTSGHGQAMAGMTHFVEAVRAGKCVRPGLVVSLDFSSGSDAYGVFALGFFRPQIEIYVAPRYGTLGHKLTELVRRMAREGNDSPARFVDGINNTSGRSWWTYFPYIVTFESELGTVAGIPSVTIATVSDSRSYVDTPDDRRERICERRLARQVTTCEGKQAGLVTLATALVQWRGSFVNRGIEDTWSMVGGRVVWLDQERDYVPNQPLVDGMVFIKQRQSSKYFCGTRGIPALMTDSNGYYRLGGLR
ncbi:MAG: M28 family metallopeptidase, partial [bacterium]|nr:M28 family metallopeptidase [bacterium]